MAETSEQDRQRDEAGREAIRRLSCPVKGRGMLAQAFTVLSALLSFAPYLALVWLGDLFLAGEGPLAQADASKVHEIALLLVMAFLSQLFFRALALIITHFADMKLRYVIRKGIVERLSRAPLAWFSATESGKVRSAVQDDTKTVHTVIAHGPVDRLNGVLQPMVLLAFMFWINWRLALIGIAKRLEEIYFPGDSLPLYIDKKSESLRVVQALRDEAHRFGITHHRLRRSKSQVSSELDAIRGIGPATVQALMRHFRSIRRLRDASLDDIAAVVGPAKARLVREHFKDE